MTTPPPPPPPPGMPPPPAWNNVGSSTAGQLASPWMRILARILDAVILGIVGVVIAGAMLASGESVGFGGLSSKGVSGGKLLAITLVGLVISFVYDAILTWKIGGTPMKKAFGMKVVDANTGQPVSLQQAATRWAVPGVFGIIPKIGGLVGFIVQIVSLVFLFTDSRRQTVSDKVAKTIVVSSK